MSFELTTEQSEALAAQSGSPVVIDPRTQQMYRLVREEVYQRLETLTFDSTPWSGEEMARLAGEAFGKLDDDDYSHYLRGKP